MIGIFLMGLPQIRFQIPSLDYPPREIQLNHLSLLFRISSLKTKFLLNRTESLLTGKGKRRPGEETLAG
jgi:hypothetical protein